MFNKNEIKSLRNALPTKGIILISEATSLSIPTVYKFFNGLKVKTETAEKIWKSGWEIAKEHQNKIASLKLLCHPTIHLN